MTATVSLSPRIAVHKLANLPLSDPRNPVLGKAPSMWDEYKDYFNQAFNPFSQGWKNPSRRPGDAALRNAARVSMGTGLAAGGAAAGLAAAGGAGAGAAGAAGAGAARSLPGLGRKLLGGGKNLGKTVATQAAVGLGIDAATGMMSSPQTTPALGPQPLRPPVTSPPAPQSLASQPQDWAGFTRMLGSGLPGPNASDSPVYRARPYTPGYSEEYMDYVNNISDNLRAARN